LKKIFNRKAFIYLYEVIGQQRLRQNRRRIYDQLPGSDFSDRRATMHSENQMDEEEKDPKMMLKLLSQINMNIVVRQGPEMRSQID